MNQEYFLRLIPAIMLVYASPLYALHTQVQKNTDIQNSSSRLVSQPKDSISETDQQPIALKGIEVKGKYKPTLRHVGSKYIVDNISASIYSKGSDAWSFFRFIPVLSVPRDDSPLKIFGSGKEIVLLVNGKSLNVPVNAYLKSLRARDIERMEILPSPSGEYKIPYGKACINIILKKKDGLKYSLSLNDTQDGVNSQSGLFNAGYNHRKISLMAGIYGGNLKNRIDNTGIYRYSDRASRTVENSISTTGKRDMQMYLNMGYTINKNSELGIQLSGSFSNVQKRTTTISDYSSQRSEGNDSTCISHIKTDRPFRFTLFSGNLNYTLHTDKKGSAFYADAAIQLSNPQYETTTVYERQHGASETLSAMNESLHQYNNACGYSLWLRYNHIFNSDVRLNNGLSLIGMNACYNNAYSILKNDTYENDATRSNILDYDNRSLSVYSTGQIQWTDKFSTDIGLRIEAFHMNGFQHIGNTRFSRNEVFLIPKLNLDYTLNDNHSFSASIYRTVFYPSYGTVNPFRNYISPTTYETGNPYMKSSSYYNISLEYDFFNDFLLSVNYSFSNNLANSATLADADGNIVQTIVNGMSDDGVSLDFKYSKTLFRGYWYLEPSLSFSYEHVKSTLEQLSERRGTGWSFDFSNHVILSKRALLSADLGYGYISRSVESSGNTYARNTIDFSLSKGFNNATLSLNIMANISGKFTSWQDNKSFSFKSIVKSFWYCSLSYSLTFGNQKVKETTIRKDANLDLRLSDK